MNDNLNPSRLIFYIVFSLAFLGRYINLRLDDFLPIIISPFGEPFTKDYSGIKLEYHYMILSLIFMAFAFVKLVYMIPKFDKQGNPLPGLPNAPYLFRFGLHIQSIGIIGGCIFMLINFLNPDGLARYYVFLLYVNILGLFFIIRGLYIK